MPTRLACSPRPAPPAPTGYVRLVTFSQNAAEDMQHAIAQLQVRRHGACAPVPPPRLHPLPHPHMPRIPPPVPTPLRSATAPRPSSSTCGTTLAASSAKPWTSRRSGSTAPRPSSTCRWGAGAGWGMGGRRRWWALFLGRPPRAACIGAVLPRLSFSASSTRSLLSRLHSPLPWLPPSRRPCPCAGPRQRQRRAA